MFPHKDERAPGPHTPKTRTGSSDLGYLPRSTPGPSAPVEVHARRFSTFALRCPGTGSARATIGAVWRAYVRWCALERNRPHPPEHLIRALRRELAAHTDGVVVLAGSGLWPDTLGAAA